MILPALSTPFSDLTGALISNQWFGKCAEMEMRVVDCMEAHGYRNCFEACALLMDDLRECNTKQKQIKRSYAMRYERSRQYWRGERTRADRYAPSPMYVSW